MKSLLAPLFALAIAAALFTNAVTAQDTSKEVTLKGTMICAKCTLKEADKCANVLVVKEDGKDVNYYLAANQLSSDHEVCTKKVENVTVTGTLADKDGKHWITATKIVD